MKSILSPVFTIPFSYENFPVGICVGTNFGDVNEFVPIVLCRSKQWGCGGTCPSYGFPAPGTSSIALLPAHIWKPLMYMFLANSLDQAGLEAPKKCEKIVHRGFQKILFIFWSFFLRSLKKWSMRRCAVLNDYTYMLLCSQGNVPFGHFCIDLYKLFVTTLSVLSRLRYDQMSCFSNCELRTDISDLVVALYNNADIFLQAVGIC